MTYDLTRTCLSANYFVSKIVNALLQIFLSFYYEIIHVYYNLNIQ
jgi:hypothetical protein